MKRRLAFAALVLIGVIVSVRLPGRAEPRHPAPAGCTIAECEPLSKRKTEFRRLDPVAYPDENPFAPAKAELGKDLFFDPLLSKSRTTSCSTCHNPGLSWGDGLTRAIGDAGNELPLRAPTLIDVAWFAPLGWDGKFPDLEAVTFAPITAKANMGLDEATLIARLSANPGYADAFTAAYGDGAINRERIENAIATFERSLVAGPAPFDRWVAGDETAITEPAKRGFDLFTGRAGCAGCHSGPSFSDGSFQDIGSAKDDDIGRAALFPSSLKLRYAFKVPTLRDVTRRAPYMHDGRLPTLAAVIDLYDKGGIDRPSRSPKIKPLNLSPQDKADLTAFLATLTSDPQPFAVPVLPR